MGHSGEAHRTIISMGHVREGLGGERLQNGDVPSDRRPTDGFAHKGRPHEGNSADGGAEATRPDRRARALEGVTAYRLAKSAADDGWADATGLKGNPLLADVVPQLIRATGSICANIAEGYARRSTRDRIRFYEYALGSVEETLAWYHVARHVTSQRDRDAREKNLTSIRRLLLVMINNERNGANWNRPKR